MGSKIAETHQSPPPFSVSPVPVTAVNQAKKAKSSVRPAALRFEDSYVEGDNAWKDRIRHEKLLIKFWSWKWDFLSQPPYNYPLNLRRASFEKRTKEEGGKLGLIPFQVYKKEEIITNPSHPKFPAKSSEFIGSKDTKNSFDLYKFPSEKNPISKISFVKEQYGIYRKLKMLQSLQTQTGDENPKNQPPPFSLPTKRILHVVNPLLC